MCPLSPLFNLRNVDARMNSSVYDIIHVVHRLKFPPVETPFSASLPRQVNIEDEEFFICVIQGQSLCHVSKKKHVPRLGASALYLPTKLGPGASL